MNVTLPKTNSNSLTINSKSSRPIHVAIIMDGNGRWAKAHGLPKIAGHKQGAQSLKSVIKCAVNEKIKYLTLFGFSSENWNRPKSEVQDLMSLLEYYLKTEIDELKNIGVRFRVIGDRKNLAQKIVTLITNSEVKTKTNSVLNLTIALNYGGRAEIVDTAKKIAIDYYQGKIYIKDIDEELFSSRVYAPDIPDPDLVIRTSGEKRISNFLLWQVAYAELVFVETLWPDFSEVDFKQSISEYNGRERRYGGSSRWP